MDKTRVAYLTLLMAVLVGLVGFWTLVMGQPITTGMLVIAALGFLLAAMDTCIGMGYGTLGTPVLLLLGFSSKLSVPSILIAQAVSAMFGFALHHRYKNVNIFDRRSKDLKIELRLVLFGVMGTIIAVLVAVLIPKLYMNTYIGLLVIAMGVIVLVSRKTAFSWLKINAISLISGFNKAMSGGGYGPVATTGIIVSGHPVKNTVGITLFSVAIINTLGFVLYLLSGTITSLAMPIFLTVGSLLGAQMGPKGTRRLNNPTVRHAFAAAVISFGIATIATAIWAMPQLIPLT